MYLEYTGRANLVYMILQNTFTDEKKLNQNLQKSEKDNVKHKMQGILKIKSWSEKICWEQILMARLTTTFYETYENNDPFH